MTEREVFERDFDREWGDISDRQFRDQCKQWAWWAWQARAARQAVPGQEPVAEVEQCNVHPSADGLYRSVVKSKERLSVQAELFVHPSTATVEAATIERCAKIAETKARSVLPIKDWSAGFHEAATQIAHAIRALASQPAQPQAEVEVEAERLKQAIINIEGARAVARADFERHPDRKTVVHCWLQDIDVVLEALSTTPQAEAQAGETAEAYEPLTDDECDEFRRLPGSFNDMMRAVHEDGWTRYCGVANEVFGNHYKRKFERALTAQAQAVKWKVVDVRQALPVTDRQDVAPATRYVYKRLYERDEVCGYAYVELPAFNNDVLVRALRNGKEEG